MLYREELPVRNLQDCILFLYKHMAQNAHALCPQVDTRLIRRTLHAFAVRLGHEEQRYFASTGQAANLENLYHSRRLLFSDSRIRGNICHLNAEEAVYDVTSCPVRTFLENLQLSQEDILSFCEEYHHGLIMGYTFARGQCCLAKDYDFPGENTCRISCYLRPANLSPEQASIFYGAGTTRHDTEECIDYAVRASYLGAVLLSCLYRELCSLSISDPERVISQVLTDTSEELLSSQNAVAVRMRRPFDTAFVRECVLWGISPSPEIFDNPILPTLIEKYYRGVLLSNIRN